MPSSLTTSWALWPNSTGFPSRPILIGRASGSCRLTCLAAPSGICPASRSRVCSTIFRVASQQLSQIVHRPDQAATTPPRHRITLTVGLLPLGVDLRFAHSPLGVGQQLFGLVRCALGQVGELGVLAAHHLQRFLPRGGAASAEFRVQVMCPTPCSAGPVAELGADRADTTGGADSPGRGGDPLHRLSQRRGVVGDATFDGTTVLSTRIRLQRSTFASTAFANRARFNPSTAPTHTGRSASSTSWGAAPAGRSRSGRTAAR
jgi:hypothetical protein